MGTAQQIRFEEFCCLYCVGNESMKLWHQAVLVIEAFLNGDDI